MPRPSTCAVYPMKRYVPSSSAALRSLGFLKAPVLIPRGRKAVAAIPKRTRLSVEGLISVSVSLIRTWLLPKSAAAKFTSAIEPTVAKVHFIPSPSPSPVASLSPSPAAASEMPPSSSALAGTRLAASSMAARARMSSSAVESDLVKVESVTDLRQAASTASSTAWNSASSSFLPHFCTTKVSSSSWFAPLVRSEPESTSRSCDASAKATSERRPLPRSLPLSLMVVPSSLASLLRDTA
mmetsp:Transcript_8703/g.22288  ORF Transcript_8703/g.22288 Transcript_8703/m.22288 type:complete len:239 (-) Transcript_8703:567-1283(-)